MSEQKFRSQWEQRFRAAGFARDRPRDGMTDFAVGLVLSTWASPDGDSIFPGEERLAADFGCSRSTITRATKRLREAGWIEKVREGSSRNGKADEYRLTLPAVGTCVTDDAQSQVSRVTDDARSLPLHASPAQLHASSVHDYESPAHGSCVVGAAPPIHGPEHLPLHNHYSDTKAVEINDPWAGLDDSPVPPPAAAGSGEGQQEAAQNQEPPPATLRVDPWTGLVEQDEEPPPAASWSDGDEEWESSAAASAAAARGGYANRATPEQRAAKRGAIRGWQQL